MHPIGTHMLVDMHGVKAELLADEPFLADLLVRSLQEAGFNVIRHFSHKFPGDQSGVTAMALLSESHAAFHTYPEYELLAMDIFSCGSADPEKALEAVVAALHPSHVEKSTTVRGRDPSMTPQRP